MSTPPSSSSGASSGSAPTPCRPDTYAPVVEVHACGRAWTLERHADLESLWEELAACDGPNPVTDTTGTAGAARAAFVDDERLPYWTELWPASLGLAEWLAENRAALQGRRCLDLGCGLGLTAIIGQWLGAQVIGMDYEEEALRFARLNAARNGVAQPLWTAMDWRMPAVAARSLDMVWAGDIMYERRFVTPVSDFLDYSVARDGVAWVAEPGRNVYATFRETLEARGWATRCARTMQVDALYRQAERVTVYIWEMRPPHT
ncbi:class I SAM-dependent methyltransferase [Nitratidesulfovibrio sp. SRB-5]|uniref:class I SAM-dependent methyltransferase n=1 Tax=Nitratidesulfovibrio sp. SRB-5 TaxID=2872636 RepID=UPI001CBC5EF8|nr:50S ribosomal protein L11 methyltransferase [Nitratidesulfovibrio sp. SRB-5]MBZ2172524.1 50S ribosomal protein L11 methyltransferase [Nitratidesulfovibrio sp. SRB-5]